MANLSDTKLGDRIAAMFKGEHGTGKSIAASSFPRPHFFLFEERWRSLYTYWMRVNPAKIKDISFDLLTGMSKFAVDEKMKAIFDRPEPSTIIIDSVTSAGDSILGKLVKGHKAEAGKKVGGIEVSVLEDYSGEDAEFRSWKDRFFEYPGHIIWIAHVILVDQKDKSGNALLPSRQIVTGAKKLAAKLPVYFDEMYHFQVNNGRYEFLTRHGGTDYAKTSLPLPEKIDFTDGNAYELITENLTKNLAELIKKQKEREELLARVKTF